MLQAWLLKTRHFKAEVLWGVGILVGALLLIKIVGRLVLGTTFLGFGTIIKALLLYMVIIFVIRFAEIKLKK
ncbi:hypothetical protein IV81_GL001747 [Pediococcus stilesii]|nr:hypothetical protein IV81_GL001747 [Pediococcus stilesii]